MSEKPPEPRVLPFTQKKQPKPPTPQPEAPRLPSGLTITVSRPTDDKS